MVAAMASILLINAASADEPKALVTKAAAESKVPTLTYYYFDGWPLCAKISVIVNDLKKTKGKEITFKNVLVGTGKSKEEIKKAKLKGHGIIAKDKSGKLVDTIEGHTYGKKEVDAVVAKLLAKK